MVYNANLAARRTPVNGVKITDPALLEMIDGLREDGESRADATNRLLIKATFDAANERAQASGGSGAQHMANPKSAFLAARR